MRLWSIKDCSSSRRDSTGRADWKVVSLLVQFYRFCLQPCSPDDFCPTFCLCQPVRDCQSMWSIPWLFVHHSRPRCRCPVFGHSAHSACFIVGRSKAAQGEWGCLWRTLYIAAQPRAHTIKMHLRYKFELDKSVWRAYFHSFTHNSYPPSCCVLRLFSYNVLSMTV